MTAWLPLWRRDVPTYQYHCRKCGKSFERIETISDHEVVKVRCPKCDSKKVTQVPGRVHVVTFKKS
jgi:putative FmdB family regulatory protein